jgi:hypothetical protein
MSARAPVCFVQQFVQLRHRAAADSLSVGEVKFGELALAEVRIGMKALHSSARPAIGAGLAARGSLPGGSMVGA